MNMTLPLSVSGLRESQKMDDLPPGMHWRGDVLWISKVIDGKRHQQSTGCKTVANGLIVFNDFLAKTAGTNIANDGRVRNSNRGRLRKGLYWKGNVIWLSRMVHGKHYNISCGTAEVRLAEQFLADFNLKAFKSEKLGVKSRQKMTFNELAQRYLDSGGLNGLRPKTIQRYKVVRDNFQEFLDSRGLGQTHVDTFSVSLIEDFKIWRHAQRVNRNGTPASAGSSACPSQRTLQMELHAVGAFFKEALRQDLVLENPVDKVRPVRVTKKLPVYLNEAEIREFLKAAATYDQWTKAPRPYGSFLYDIFVTYLKTGMRLEELRHLEWSDVDLNNREIYIRIEKIVNVAGSIEVPASTAMKLLDMGVQKFGSLNVDEKRALLQGPRKLLSAFHEIRKSDVDFSSLDKGILKFNYAVNWKPKSTGRTIPISDGLVTVLDRRPRTSNLVFPDPDSSGLWHVRTIFYVKRCAEHAKIQKRVHPHTFRHTFATQLRRKGVPLETIKELLGHADFRHTLIYAHFSPEESRAAIPKIDFF